MGNNLESRNDYKETHNDLHTGLIQGHCMPLTKKLCTSKESAKNLII